ncbi:MAG TPA: sugar O-acetyltransferase [Candidatus Eisenbergiella stercorigallinarum]|uniref:Acetyltransferase n=1 Tax=Candidatus Eisenbergiella stercorigallinarum TaxID=2838557 RepID=A0A9D2R2A1_9FIRM|nr:sugar O-acetyltransferase [Candidatus Eisenbergiella stercorigallinarum]
MNSKEAKKRMMEGRIYPPGDEEIMAEQVVCMQKLWEYNQIQPKDMDKRFPKLQDMFAEIGEGSYIEPPLHANFGGKHVHFGKYVYANYNLTMVDDTHIYVGDYTMIGPNVTIATAGHPIDPALRSVQAQYNMEVHIGKNVWIGGGCVLLPGVSIGDNTVIGAGSIVTKDIPANVVAYGNPCRVIREIGGHDRQYYYRDRKVDVEVRDGQIESLTPEE